MAGTYATKPTDEETLIAFYRNVRPWGFWGPIHKKAVVLDPSFQENHNFRRDMFNVVVGTVWQTSLVLLPMYVVLLKWRAAAIVAGVVVLTSGILKKSWYDALGKEAVTGPAGPAT
jgi:SSS family solute:Na+ symporter